MDRLVVLLLATAFLLLMGSCSLALYASLDDLGAPSTACRSQPKPDPECQPRNGSWRTQNHRGNP
jgi:hypothetical protein